MNRVICLPKNKIPSTLQNNAIYYSMFSPSELKGVGSIATGLLDDPVLKKANPSLAAWDFMTFALAVNAADLAIKRSNSADGWTRIIELEVALQNVKPYIINKSLIEEMLRSLTGDFWHLTFSEGGLSYPVHPEPIQFDADCVCLLSGGMDSLIGAIDLTAQGKKPLFVSQLVKGNREDQYFLAKALKGEKRHLLLNSNIRSPVKNEISTRARSIIFYGFAALAVSVVNSSEPINLYVPENGFISLNMPLSPARIGSLSTKTTHPVFLRKLQQLFEALNINAKFVSPYRFLTKGEAMQQCLDIPLMNQLMPKTTSCGKYGRLNEHCGRCLPCLVRRAAFFKAGIADPTPSYRYKDLKKGAPRGNANDTQAVAIAYLRYLSDGIDSLSAGSLSFSTASERNKFKRVLESGITELGVFLKSEGVI